MTNQRYKEELGSIERVPSKAKRNATKTTYTYRASYTHNGDRSGTATFKSLSEARAWLHTEHQLIVTDTWTPYRYRKNKRRNQDQTVKDHYNQYVEDKIPTVRETTIKNFRARQKRFHLFTWMENKTPQQVTRDDCLRFYKELLEHNNGRLDITAYRLIRDLRTIFEQLVENDSIGKNPFRAIKAKEPKKIKQPKILTSKEYYKLIPYYPEHAQPAALAIFTLGLRKSEAIGLQLGDFHFFTKNGELTGEVKVQRAVSSSSKHINDPKTEKSRRTVPITPLVCKQFKQAIEQRRQQGATDTDFLTVIPGQSKPLNPTTFDRYSAKVAKQANIPHEYLQSHNGRRAVVTDLIDKGISPKTVADIVGHTDTSVTLNVYAQTSVEKKRNAMAELHNNYTDQES